MSEFINFLWVAFHDYFLVWLSGGGVIGAILIGIALWERHRGVPMRKTIYFSILAIALVVCATFSAWHDSQKNLKAVIEQRSVDTSKLGTCTSDLQNQKTLTISWQDRFADEQKSINALQAPQLQQQSTINSCVLSLGKMNPIVHRVVRVIVMPFSIRDKFYYSEMIITTNQNEPQASGDLRCDNDFEINSPPSLPAIAGKNFVGGIAATKISDHEYLLSLQTLASYWGPTTPILLPIRTTTEERRGCIFTPQ
jgi:hypothetical protein